MRVESGLSVTISSICAGVTPVRTPRNPFRHNDSSRRTMRRNFARRRGPQAHNIRPAVMRRHKVQIFTPPRLVQS